MTKWFFFSGWFGNPCLLRCSYRLTFLENHLHNDAVSVGRWPGEAQGVAAVVVQVVVVSRVTIVPGHVSGRAKGARPTQLSRPTKTPQAKSCPHHKGQKTFSHLLNMETYKKKNIQLITSILETSTRGEKVLIVNFQKRIYQYTLHMHFHSRCSFTFRFVERKICGKMRVLTFPCALSIMI